jgi:hypothetical protein
MVIDTREKGEGKRLEITNHGHEREGKSRHNTCFPLLPSSSSHPSGQYRSRINLISITGESLIYTLKV